MSGARLAKLTDRGFGIAAAKLGQPHNHYRPAAPLAPIGPASLIGTLVASFDPSTTLTFSAPPNRGNVYRTALVDGRVIQVGDYLIGPQGTHFLTVHEPFLPIQAVLCNATVDILQVTIADEVGPLGYGHDTRAVEVAQLHGWPASLTLRGTGGMGEAGLPGTPTDPSMLLLLPVLPPGAAINTGNAVTDDLGRRLIVTAAERTAQGWACSVRLASGG